VITINPKQFAMFEAQADRAFAAKVARYLRRRHAGAVVDISDAVLRQRVDLAIARGRTHGFTTMYGLGAYAALCVELAPDFDTHPAFEAALAMRLPSDKMRIAAIFGNVTDEDWNEAQDENSDFAWASMAGKSAS
jgi:hypothetical protein